MSGHYVDKWRCGQVQRDAIEALVLIGRIRIFRMPGRRSRRPGMLIHARVVAYLRSKGVPDILRAINRNRYRHRISAHPGSKFPIVCVIPAEPSIYAGGEGSVR